MKRIWQPADDLVAIAWTLTLEDIADFLERDEREVLARLRELECLPRRVPSEPAAAAAEEPEIFAEPVPRWCGGRLNQLVAEHDVSREAMGQEEAEAAASRVLLHLLRGSIEQARAALESAWAAHVESHAPPPVGRELLAKPLISVLDGRSRSLGSANETHDAARIANLLERGGILTVADLLSASPVTLSAIPNIGVTTIARLHEEKLRLRRLVAQETDAVEDAA